MQAYSKATLSTASSFTLPISALSLLSFAKCVSGKFENKSLTILKAGYLCHDKILAASKIRKSRHAETSVQQIRKKKALRHPRSQCRSSLCSEHRHPIFASLSLQ